MEAIDAHDRSGDFAAWNFNRSVFDALDWSQEPAVDLWSLYVHRCRQIRESYDYCVIFYSGGSDSENVLKAWIASGSRIDEIATFKIASANIVSGNFDWAVEVPQVVEPMIQQLRAQGHDFRYREIDSVDLTLNFVKQNIEDYVYHSNGALSPNNGMKSLLRETIKDYRHIVDAGRRLCFVWGSEKPQIRYHAEDGGWYFDFLDIVDNCVPPLVQENFHKGWFDELFYWTPDLPLIPIKQAHELKRWCTTVHDPYYYQDSWSAYGFNPVIKKYLSESAAKQAIYPQWQTATLVAPKPRWGAVRPGWGRYVFSERDRWFFDSGHLLVQKYQNQIESCSHKISNHSRFDWIPQPGSGNQSLLLNCRQSHRFA